MSNRNMEGGTLPKEFVFLFFLRLSQKSLRKKKKEKEEEEEEFGGGGKFACGVVLECNN